MYNNHNDSDNHKHKHNHDEFFAYDAALLRSLHFSGVQFLRYCTVDAFNNIRCKAKPVEHLLRRKERGGNRARGPSHSRSHSVLDHQVSIAEICYAGLPSYADVAIAGTGLTASDVLVLRPDMGSFRILPYAPRSAMVMGSSVDQYTHETSPLCTRSLLGMVVERARNEHNLIFSVGVELEFCLVDAKTHEFVDESVFAGTTILNEREDFVGELYDQLKRQYVPVELVHAESGPGQLEVVLEHSDDPVGLADSLLLARETIRALARSHGHKALFLPKYDAARAGNGMHVHLSVSDATTGAPVFCEGDSLAQRGSSLVEGILHHLPGLLGLTMPTANSFRRVGPGCWTGSRVGWALEDKEAGVRVCSNLATGEWDHVELKLFDASCNPYLGLAAVLSSGLDGIARGMELRPPLSKDQRGPLLPETLLDALDHLEKDATLSETMGPRLAKAYLAVRRHEAERSSGMTLEDELEEALARS